MKKILAIVSMAAMVAGAAFAADVSMKVKLDGSLFKYDNDKKITAGMINYNSEHWNPFIDFAFNGEKAGAEVKFYNGSAGEGKAVNNGQWNIWFKPFDVLTFKVGTCGTELNKEHIDWGTESGCGSQGYAAIVSTNGFNFETYLIPGAGKDWFSMADGSDPAVAESYIKLAYGADFGTVDAMFDYKGKDDMKFGAGYNGKAGPVAFFVTGLGYLTTKITKVRGEIYGEYANDGLGLKLYVPVDYTLSGSVFAVGTTFKATYGFNSVTAYLYVKDGNWLADNFAIEVKPGVTGNVGEMSYDVALDANIDTSKANSFSLNVPVSFVVQF